ncbi:MAG: hypothetical protein ACXVWF_03335 [Actinomycetota bacterium]
MEPDDGQFSQALDEAVLRRRTLHDALVHLEQAISSPAAGRIPEWTDRVHKDLLEVGHAFEQHVSVTERPDGLYDEILGLAPRLDGNVRRLREEHPEIAKAIAAMDERLGSVQIGTDAWSLDQARDDLQRLIGRVIRHRQHGADLVWEAYNVDIGGRE